MEMLRCHCAKPALTKCIKGTFCKQCGEKCHGQFQHPIQFIVHEPQKQGLVKNKIMKSMVLLSTKNLGPVPHRLSKVDSKIKMARFESSRKMSEKKTEKMQEKFKCNKKKLSLVQKTNKLTDAKSPLAKISLQATASIKKQKQRENQQNELATLREKVSRQAGLLELMRHKLQAQKKKNKQIQAEYEQRLRLIRKLRD